MRALKTETHLEVEHNGTRFHIPKQHGEVLYIRLMNDDVDGIVIQVEFPSESPEPTQLAMSYNMEPEKRMYVSDSDLQNIGEALMLLAGAIPDEQHDNNSQKSDRQSIISQEGRMSPKE